MNMAKCVADDSRAHGYLDANWPVSRTMTKAAVEMGECINAYRDSRNAGTSAYKRKKAEIEQAGESHGQTEARMTANYNTHCKNTVQDEFADMAIYTLLAIGNGGMILLQTERMTSVAKYAEEVKKHGDFVTSMRTVLAFMNEVDFPEDDDLTKKYAARYALRLLDFLDAFFSIYFPCEDLWWWVEQKMRYNRNRAHLHGRKNDPTI